MVWIWGTSPSAYNHAMHEPDPNETAHRVAGKATKSDDLPADLEAAWEAWSKSIKGVDDERTWTLLRAAFEAGAEAQYRPSSA